MESNRVSHARLSPFPSSHRPQRAVYSSLSPLIIAIFIGIPSGKARCYKPAGLGLRCPRMSSFACLDTFYVMGRNYANKGRTISKVMGEWGRGVPEKNARERKN